MKKFVFPPPILVGIFLLGLFIFSIYAQPIAEIRQGSNQPILGNIRPVPYDGYVPVKPARFFITADIRQYAGPGIYDSSQYLRGTVENIALINLGDFMISPGDLDPTNGVFWTITQTLGTDYSWYPVIGNHELPGHGYEINTGDNLKWLQSFNYGAVNHGPAGCPTTSYAFDYQNMHFVILNEYCDENGPDTRDGDISDHLYTWLENDLTDTLQPIIFVVGHEPAFPQPDSDSGRIRHLGDSLDKYPTNRDRFWNLLREQGVLAYICGHTHNYSIVNFEGVWQIDVGHARGLGDTGAPSTFVMVQANSSSAWYETYRDDSQGGAYTRRHSGFLLVNGNIYFPLVINKITNSQFNK